MRGVAQGPVGEDTQAGGGDGGGGGGEGEQGGGQGGQTRKSDAE
jgi:hypothetical protein